MARVETVRIEGLAQLDRALRELPQRVANRGLRASVYAGAKVIRDEARARAPKAAHRWHTVSRPQLASGDRFSKAPIQLQIDRRVRLPTRLELPQIQVRCPSHFSNSCTYWVGRNFPKIPDL